MIGEAEMLGERKTLARGVKEMLQEATKLAQKLRFLVEEVRKVLTTSDWYVYYSIQTFLYHIPILTLQPQHTVPDMFVWLLSNNKRVAYARLRTRDLLYSSNQEARGILCGKIVTLYLKVRTCIAHCSFNCCTTGRKKKSSVFVCVIVCAATREATCSIVSPSQAGCVSVVWSLLRLQPYAGWPACRIQTSHRGRRHQQPSFLPALHGWGGSTFMYTLGSMSIV